MVRRNRPLLSCVWSSACLDRSAETFGTCMHVITSRYTRLEHLQCMYVLPHHCSPHKKKGRQCTAVSSDVIHMYHKNTRTSSSVGVHRNQEYFSLKGTALVSSCVLRSCPTNNSPERFFAATTSRHICTHRGCAGA